MSSYSLPVSAASTKRLPKEFKSVRYKVTLPSRKRKRHTPTPDPTTAEQVSDDEPLPLATSTNPLSLTPAEIAQYKLAGLPFDEQLPNIKDFPHRALPVSRYKSRQNSTSTGSISQDAGGTLTDSAEEELADTDKDISFREGIAPRLRTQHFKVMVAILHRCLREGDIQRALRAWTILLRVQFNNRMLDIRSTGYWAIGAELLARSEEFHDHPEDGPVLDDVEKPTTNELEWGTKAGRAKAVDYLGTLVVEFPYNKHYWKSISAVDFWPSMLAIEIYGIQYEQKRLLAEIAEQLRTDTDDLDSEPSTGGSDSGSEGERPHNGSGQRPSRRLRELEEDAWLKREQARHTTLTAAEALATRVDELLAEPLYTANNTIISIRAHLALYIGDLSVPEMPLEVSDEEMVDQRFQSQQRIEDHKRGQRIRDEEIDRATGLARKIITNGGNAAELSALLADNPESSDDDDG